MTSYEVNVADSGSFRSRIQEVGQEEATPLGQLGITPDFTRSLPHPSTTVILAKGASAPVVALLVILVFVIIVLIFIFSTIDNTVKPEDLIINNKNYNCKCDKKCQENVYDKTYLQASYYNTEDERDLAETNDKKKKRKLRPQGNTFFGVRKIDAYFTLLLIVFSVVILYEIIHREDKSDVYILLINLFLFILGLVFYVYLRTTTITMILMLAAILVLFYWKQKLTFLTMAVLEVSILASFSAKRADVIEKLRNI